MNQALIDAVAERLKDYPLYSQENTDLNPIISAKLFNAAGAGRWWLAEYDPVQKLAFGYVSIFGDHCDEWGYISLEELASLDFHGWHCIELDLHFTPCHFKDLSLSKDGRPA